MIRSRPPIGGSERCVRGATAARRSVERRSAWLVEEERRPGREVGARADGLSRRRRVPVHLRRSAICGATPSTARRPGRASRRRLRRVLARAAARGSVDGSSSTTPATSSTRARCRPETWPPSPRCSRRSRRVTVESHRTASSGARAADFARRLGGTAGGRIGLETIHPDGAPAAQQAADARPTSIARRAFLRTTGSSSAPSCWSARRSCRPPSGRVGGPRRRYAWTAAPRHVDPHPGARRERRDGAAGRRRRVSPPDLAAARGGARPEPAWLDRSATAWSPPISGTRSGLPACAACRGAELERIRA